MRSALLAFVATSTIALAATGGAALVDPGPDSALVLALETAELYQASFVGCNVTVAFGGSGACSVAWPLFGSTTTHPHYDFHDAAAVGGSWTWTWRDAYGLVVQSRTCSNVAAGDATDGFTGRECTSSSSGGFYAGTQRLTVTVEGVTACASPTLVCTFHGGLWYGTFL